MSQRRMTVWYSGRVQGVGFRFAARQVAMGFDAVGTVRNLEDGQVELTAEGQQAELEAFLAGIRDSGLRRFIRDERVSWGEASGEFKGFEIVR